MGWLDKILGRDKKAADDMTGDTSTKREGMAEERAEMHEDAAMDSREEAAEHQSEREGM